MSIRKTFLIITIAVSIIFLLVYFYNKNAQTHINSETIPLLVPSENPIKIKPEYRGGKIIPHADSLVYNKIKKNPHYMEKVAIKAGPEDPIDLDYSQSNDNKIINKIYTIDDILANIDQYEKELFEMSDRDVSDDVIMPNRVDKFLVNDEGELREQDGDADNKYNYLNIEYTNNKRYDFSKSLAPNNHNNSKNYYLQISVAYSLQDAEKKWNVLRINHHKILKNYEFTAKKIKTNAGRSFYLVLAGGFSESAKAKSVCRKLINSKCHCIIFKG